MAEVLSYTTWAALIADCKFDLAEVIYGFTSVTFAFLVVALPISVLRLSFCPEIDAFKTLTLFVNVVNPIWAWIVIVASAETDPVVVNTAWAWLLLFLLMLINAY